MPRLAKVTVPTLFDRLTPIPADAPLFTLVAPNVTEVPLARASMLIPVPPGFVMVVAPIVALPPPTECKRPTPLLPLTDSEVNVRVPAELFWRDTPSVPPLTLVMPKFIFAVDVPIKMP